MNLSETSNQILQHSNEEFERFLNNPFENFNSGRDYIETICKDLLKKIQQEGKLLDPREFICNLVDILKVKLPVELHTILDGFPNPDKQKFGRNRRIVDFFSFFRIPIGDYTHAMGSTGIIRNRVGSITMRKLESLSTPPQSPESRE